jgi:hypothetical protein
MLLILSLLGHLRRNQKNKIRINKIIIRLVVIRLNQVQTQELHMLAFLLEVKAAEIAKPTRGNDLLKGTRGLFKKAEWNPL